MLADIADRIALAGHPAEIDELIKEVWGHHFAGALTEDEAETLDEAARARREVLQPRRPETRPKTTDSPFRRTTGLGSQATAIARQAGLD